MDQSCLFFHFLSFPFLYMSESEYSVQACGIHADFLLGRHVYQEIDDALQGYEIGILGEHFDTILAYVSNP